MLVSASVVFCIILRGQSIEICKSACIQIAYTRTQNTPVKLALPNLTSDYHCASLRYIYTLHVLDHMYTEWATRV